MQAELRGYDSSHCPASDNPEVARILKDYPPRFTPQPKGLVMLPKTKTFGFVKRVLK